MPENLKGLIDSYKEEIILMQSSNELRDQNIKSLWDKYLSENPIFDDTRDIPPLMNAEFDQQVNIVGDRPGKDAAYLLDSEKLRKSLAWKDSVTLDQGINEVIDWVDSNMDILEREKDYYIHKP